MRKIVIAVTATLLIAIVATLVMPQSGATSAKEPKLEDHFQELSRSTNGSSKKILICNLMSITLKE